MNLIELLTVSLLFAIYLMVDAKILDSIHKRQVLQSKIRNKLRVKYSELNCVDKTDYVLCLNKYTKKEHFIANK